MPKKFTSLVGLFLDIAVCKIKTTFGIIKEAYSRLLGHFIAGSGQGSVYSGSGWAKNVAIAADTYDEYADASHYVNSSFLLDALETIVGFVDNNGIALNGSKWEKTLNLLERAATNAEIWNRIVFVTGGALNLDKCFVHIIGYLFTPRGLPVVADKNDTIQFHLTDIPCKTSLLNKVPTLESTLVPPLLTIAEAE